MKKKVLIVLGHPRNDSFCAALADNYEKGVKAAGHEVKKLLVSDLKIDVLRDPEIQEENPEEDVLKMQKYITWANHLVFVYPTWWGAMPAISKTIFERVFTRGFAFKYRDNSPWWDKLLSGKSARIIVTMDAPPFVYKFMFGQSGHKLIKQGILGFCGVKPVKITSIGPVRSSSNKKREMWLKKVEDYGEKVI